MNSWLCNKSKTAFLLFIIALLVRLIILFYFDNNRVPPDGTGYHRIAVNLVRGNGFSNQEVSPFDKYYFREPGYPFFLAGIYSVVNIFHPVQYIKQYNIDTYKMDKKYPEIVVAKIIQIVLDSIGIVLLFLVLLEMSNIKIAFLTALLTATFFNLAYHCVFLLRESLVVFLLLILNYCFIKYIFKEKKHLWLLLMGITIGLLILIFQVHVIILPVLYVLFVLHSKKIGKTILHSLFVTIVAIVITLPHSIIVYRFYPDLRVFKSFGTSLTYEANKYMQEIYRLQYYGILNVDEGNKIHPQAEANTDQFKKSFNGYYLAKADSLNLLVNEPIFSKRKLAVYSTNFRKSFFLTTIGNHSGKELINDFNFSILIPLLIYPIMIGIFGLFGLVLYSKKYLFYLLPFLVYLSLFWILGDEYRRMIILQPFLIFFSLIFFSKIPKLINKNNV